MTLVEEGLLAMRGCWRLLWRDTAAFDHFNISIDGFWRSFAMVAPVVVLAYPLFISDHRFGIELAQAGENPPELRLGTNYFYLLSGIVVWPLLAAALAWLLGVSHNYVRYMIIYNWMAVPDTGACRHSSSSASGDRRCPAVADPGAGRVHRAAVCELVCREGGPRSDCTGCLRLSARRFRPHLRARCVDPVKAR